MWVVMRAHSWESLEVSGLALRNPDNGHQRFIPVFNTKEQAVAWSGSDEFVHRLYVSAPRSGGPASE